MGNKLFYVSVVAICLIIVFCSCSSDGINHSIVPSMQLLSFDDHGCISSDTLAKPSDEAVMEWQYTAGYLQLDFFLTSHCSAECTDSFVVENNLLKIFVADISQTVAKCTCRLKETFYFQINSNQQLKLLFYYRSVNKKEYSLLIDKTIDL